MQIAKNADQICKNSKASEKRAAEILGHLKSLGPVDRKRCFDTVMANEQLPPAERKLFMDLLGQEDKPEAPAEK